MTFDIVEALAVNEQACFLEDGTRVSTFPFASETGHSANGIRLTKNGETLLERGAPREPPLEEFGYHAGAGLACSGNRFAFAHPLLGYLAVFDAQGEELWRRQIPAFAPVTPAVVPNWSGSEYATIRAEKDTFASLVLNAWSLGDVFVVSHETGRLGFYHTAFHQSGVLLGQAGPSDWIVHASDDAALALVGGGGVDVRTYVPGYEVGLTIRHRRLDDEIAHLIAWLLPRVTDREPALSRCLARQPEELRYWLKEEFDASLAERAKGALIVLGNEWIATLSEHPAVAEVMSRFAPVSPQWVDELRRALLEAGVDVDYARVRYEGKVAEGFEQRVITLRKP